MKKFLADIISTATFKQSSITTIGTVLNGVLGALFFITVARILGPNEFGLLTISIVTLTLVSDIADIGTNTGLVRFVSFSLAHDKDKAMRFLKLSLEIKLIVWSLVFSTIFLLAPLLAKEIFHKVELILPLRLVAIGVGGALLFSFATSSIQAFQKYFLWSGINILTNLLRLILIFILGYSFSLSLESSLVVYIILPFFGFFIALLILPAKKIFFAKGEWNLSKQLFAYNIPAAIFTVIAAFSARLDTYLSASLLPVKEVGIYGAANQLAQVMPQLVSAIGLVAAPKFASFQSKEQMLTYFKKLQLLITALCVLGVLSIPVVAYLIPFIFGQSYQEAVTPYIFIFLAMLVFLFSVPVHNAIIFYFGKPGVFIPVAFGHLLIISILGYLLISNFGIIGASITVLIGTIFNFIYPLIWLLIKLKR